MIENHRRVDPHLTVAYHYSPSGNRASILSDGLYTRHPTTGLSLAERDGHPAGVYLFVDLQQALALDSGDIFEVDVSSIATYDDPFHDTARIIVVYQHVCPMRIRWLQAC
jgi:hypothetical protein